MLDFHLSYSFRFTVNNYTLIDDSVSTHCKHSTNLSFIHHVSFPCNFNHCQLLHHDYLKTSNRTWALSHSIYYKSTFIQGRCSFVHWPQAPGIYYVMTPQRP